MKESAWYVVGDATDYDNFVVERDTDPVLVVDIVRKPASRPDWTGGIPADQWPENQIHKDRITPEQISEMDRILALPVEEDRTIQERMMEGGTGKEIDLFYVVSGNGDIWYRTTTLVSALSHAERMIVSDPEPMREASVLHFSGGKRVAVHELNKLYPDLFDPKDET